MDYADDLSDHCDRLEKALDKAIVTLILGYHIQNPDDDKDTYYYDEWKKWLLAK